MQRQITPAERGRLANKNEAINRVLSLMGTEGGGGDEGRRDELAAKAADGTISDEEMDEYFQRYGGQ